MIYWIGHVFWIIVSKVFFPCHVKGLENIPSGGCILASNHLSNLDPMIVGISSRRRLSYMAKDSLFKNSFFSFVLYQVNAFPVKRGSADIGALRTALKRLSDGSPLVVFPEGTRKKGNTDQQIQSGIGFLAVKSGVPVIPVLIEGADKVLPPGVSFPRRHRVNVVFGPAKKYDAQKEYSHIAEDIVGAIQSLKKSNP